MMGGIAIVGTEGCGKTVLLTALAKRFELPSKAGVFLEPVNRRTADYVDDAWQQLMSGGWPKGTEPGAAQKLRWRLHVGKDRTGEVVAIDPAGQDLRGLFDDDQDSDGANLTKSQRELLQFLKTVDCLVYLLNMQDFMAEADENRRRSNEWTLKHGMDALLGEGPSLKRRHCIVFTQVDLYPAVPATAELGDLVRRYLPKVYAAHFQGHDVPVFAVAAVNKTQVLIRDGKPLRVPSEDFGSTGLDELVAWLAAVDTEERPHFLLTPRQTTASEQQVPEAAKSASPAPVKKTPKEVKPSAPMTWHQAIGGAVVFTFLIWRGCSAQPKGKPNSELDKLLRELKPAPVQPNGKQGALESRQLNGELSATTSRHQLGTIGLVSATSPIAETLDWLE